jgi:hypothetical protein
VAFSEVLKLDLPDLFPLQEFEQYHFAAREVLPRPSDYRTEFGRASNVTAWRFRACVEHKTTLCASWAAEGPHSFEALYFQERNLFEMFACGVSTIESVCYACYALLSFVEPSLPFDEPARRAWTSPGKVVSLLGRTRPQSALTAALQEVIASREWRVWRRYRNAMSHRGSVPRIIRGLVGGSPPPPLIFQFAPTSSTDALEGNEEVLTHHLLWLAASTRKLFVAGAALARGA